MLYKNSVEKIMGEIPHEVLQQGGFVGPRFHGVFFFQNVYWRVVIPLIFGTCRVDAFNALSTMPEQTKRHLRSNPDKCSEYVLLWVDCLDYDLGFQRATSNPSKNLFLNEMIRSVDRELNSAISELCQKSPNPNAMYSARNCLEKALKGFLAFKVDLSAEKAKSQFGHDLNKLTSALGEIQPVPQLASIRDQIGIFPLHLNHYTGQTFSPVDLWRAYRLAQFAAAELTRSVTGQNQRAGVQLEIKRSHS